MQEIPQKKQVDYGKTSQQGMQKYKTLLKFHLHLSCKIVYKPVHASTFMYNVYAEQNSSFVF